MKINKYSFLFFCFLGIKFFCGFSLNAQGESKKDSVLFYYKTITVKNDSSNFIKYLRKCINLKEKNILVAQV